MLCLGVVLFGSTLFGTLCASGACMSISFTKLGKICFTVFLNKFSISCSSSYPSDTPMIQMLVCLRCPRGLLFYPCFFYNSFFLLSLLIECFFLPCVPNCWFDTWLHPLHSWFPVDFSFTFSLSFFLLLFNYSCMPFLPIPPPHPMWTHLPPPSPTSPLVLSMCPL